MQGTKAMMEEQHQEKPFNPYYRFGIKSVLSKVAPDLYTEEELTELEEIEEEIMNNSTSERRAKPQKKKKEKKSTW